MATVLTNAGEEFLIDKLLENVQTKPEYIGWGTGAGTADKTDTTLFTEASEARVQATCTKVGSGGSAKYQAVGTMTADGTKAITNVGLLTASSSGTLVIHVDHGTLNVDAGDQVEYTFTLDPQ